MAPTGEQKDSLRPLLGHQRRKSMHINVGNAL
jgi:hypothetical protein